MEADFLYDDEEDETGVDMHEADLAFMRSVRESSDENLRVLLRWQAVEPWRREAIYREIRRRAASSSPTEPSEP